MNLESVLVEPLPHHDAARFFAGLTKKAEWTDPPDMTGELEGKFAVPLEQVLFALKGVITAKLRLMVGYYTYAQTFNDYMWRAIKIEFHEHASDEQEGATFYTKRATALGGAVHIDEILPPPPANHPKDVIIYLMRAEQEMIHLQRELRALVGDDNPMKIGIEECMHEDQHHLDELFQMLPAEERAALSAPPMPEAVGGGDVPEAPAPLVASVAEPAPAEIPKMAHVIANMRFMAALTKLGFGPEMQPQTQLPIAPGQEGAPSGQMPPEMGAVPTEAPEGLSPNYFAAEQMGQQIQNQAEADYYKQLLVQSRQQAEQMTQQMGQLQQQADGANEQIQAANQQAMQAQEAATAHAAEMARARMASQKMREAMLDLASQDPNSFVSPTPDEVAQQQQQVAEEQAAAQQGGQVPSVDASGQQPTDDGAAGQSVTPQNSPGTTDTSSGGGSGDNTAQSESPKDKQSTSPTVSLKVGMANFLRMKEAAAKLARPLATTRLSQ